MLPSRSINDEEKLYSLASDRRCHRFSLAEMHSATLNFDDDLVIGKGGFGNVYKGHVFGTKDTNPRVVAVKRLDALSRQGAFEFMIEIEMLSELRHCNLVSLIGYCSESQEMILVYKYMLNGTIEHHIHKADNPLSWMQRLKISVGAARGLDYLHTGVGTQHGIIHRDVKSSNILLDENWEAKISDFGLSKIINQPVRPLKAHLGVGLQEYSFRIFSYSDMEVATRNFSSYMLLGGGHNGDVFKGWLDKRTYLPSQLDGGLAIAVRRLYPFKFKLGTIKEFNMKILEEFNDPNIVKILGYCVEQDLVLIVYEFMHQGTLKDYLFSVERRTERHLLVTRVKIAIGVARGLLFLRTKPQLADCSLRIQNILLDEEFNAKLADFDVGMLLPSSDAPSSPHPTSSSKLTDCLQVKGDVFDYGVMLLEILTGEPMADSCDLMVTRHRLAGEHASVSRQSIYDALDIRIILNTALATPAIQLVVLAQKCVVDESYLRPTLESVLDELENIYAIILKIQNIGNQRGDGLIG